VARPFPRPFGKYTLLASLGRGGMGEVFAASFDADGRGQTYCVIKTLHANLAEDREHVSRFLDEARLAVRLIHRNICPVFDVGVVDGQRYLAMEMVRGRDLRTIWKVAADQGRPIDRGVSLHVLAEALDALDYAHQLADERGQPLAIVHRDVSPQNIMVSFDGDVKVIDFGLAASTMKVERTETNVVLGKVPYMPPEQVRGERLDARADVFAVAVITFEFITGRRFYDGVDPYNLSAVVASGAYLPPGFQQLDPDLRAILWRGLAGDRNRRTRSAGLFAEELRIYAATHGARVDAETVPAFMNGLFGGARAPWEVSAPSPVVPAPRTLDGHGAVPFLAADDDPDVRTETDVIAPPRQATASSFDSTTAEFSLSVSQSITVPLAVPVLANGDVETGAPPTGAGGHDADAFAIDIDLDPTGRTERVVVASPTPPAAQRPRLPLAAAVGTVVVLVALVTALARNEAAASATSPPAGLADAAAADVYAVRAPSAVPAVDAGAPALPAVPAVVDAGAPALPAVPAVVDAGAPALPAVPAVVDAGAPAVPTVVDAGAPAVPIVVDAGAPALPAVPAVVDAATRGEASPPAPAPPAPPPADARPRPKPGSRLDVALNRVEKAAANGKPAFLLETIRNVCGPSLCGELPRDDDFAARVEDCRRRCVDWILSR
jgi:serine/threonine-protein kinase